MKKIAGIGLILVGVLVLIASLPSFFSFSKGTIGNEFAKEVNSINHIKLTSVSADWDIQTYDGEELIVQLERKNDRVKLHTSEQGSQLNIEVKGQRFPTFPFHFGKKQSVATVLVPRTYKKELDVKAVSGNIDLIEWHSPSIVKAKTISGDIWAEDVSARNALMETTSGDIEITHLVAEQTELKSTSGDILIDTMTGEITCHNVSGDIRIGFEQENQTTSLKTISGDIDVSVPTGNADVQVKTLSGDIALEFELKDQSLQSRSISGKIGEGVYPFFVSTTSGDVYIRK
ncbi:DUF4097 domain-containing protein [bacterium LRH843]|nr:DUF4097 domain-containing protein [bacterium LRH843]